MGADAEMKQQRNVGEGDSPEAQQRARLDDDGDFVSLLVELANSPPAISKAAPDGEEARRSPEGGRKSFPRGVVVELIRLITVTAFALIGSKVGQRIAPEESYRLLVVIGLGSAIGYVVGGVFGRRTATAVSQIEREFRRTPAAEILAGAIGLGFGLLLATLLSLPLFRLPASGAYPAIVFVYVITAYLGLRVGRSKSDELFALFGVKPRAAGTHAGEVAVLDSSVLLDGRLHSLVRLGFLSGTLLVTRSVLEELQLVADSSNAGRRGRGRRALDLLMALKRDPSVDVVLVEGDWRVPGQPVDSELVRLAKERGAAVVTNDANLGKVASALDVPVRSIHALAQALRPQVVAGEQVAVHLTRRGRESGQGVGYLEDGTMVVVEAADHLLGETVTVSVTNALQTSNGRLVFGRVAGAA